MAVRLIRDNADTTFLGAIEAYAKRTGSTGALLCRFSLSSQTIQSDALMAAVNDVIANYDGEVYLCLNRDVLIVWNGPLAPVTAALKSLIKSHFRGILTHAGEKSFYQFYDMRRQAGVARSVFTARVNGDSNVTLAELTDTQTAVLDFSAEQLATLTRGIRERATKRGLESLGLNIMVVEDQEFSLKLLTTYLSRQHACVTATNATEALGLYAKHAPDIIFLDVELPDASGHDLAALIRHHDPEAFIIMVTANNYAKDVKLAQKNKVQAYITKPFQQNKIQAGIDLYVKSHRE